MWTNRRAVFAAYLNGPPSLVSKWERREKHPLGASLKLLSQVEKKGLEDVA
jgi:putative transcriptional regulator